MGIEHSPWGVIFDWDGVVVDSKAAHEASWDRLADAEGLHLPADHFLKGFGKTNEFIIPEMLRWTRDPQEIRRLSLGKETHYRDIIAETGITVLPGVRDLLAALTDAGVPFAVGSSTHRANIEMAMKVENLSGFRGIVSAEDVERGKPEPEVFLKVAALIDRPPAKCVVIEDSHSGIEAAKRGGIPVVGVATTNPIGELGACDLVVNRLTEVTLDDLRALTH